MLLNEFLPYVRYNIFKGYKSSALADCFGNNARWLMCRQDDFKNEVHCLFDEYTQQIYLIEITGNKAYRCIWVDPEYSKDYFSRYHHSTEIKDIQDMLRKAEQIISTGVCDDKETIELQLEDDVLLSLALAAHKRDITLNEMVELILKNIIDSAKE